MTRLIVSLYDRPKNARRVVDSLRHAGFDDSQIEHIERHREDRNLFRRAFRSEKRNGALEAAKFRRLLSDMGIPEEDAEHYAQEVTRGRSLVVVQSDDEISGRAKQIMSQAPIKELGVENSYGDHDVALHPNSPRDTREPPPHTHHDVDVIRTITDVPESAPDEAVEQSEAQFIDTTTGSAEDEAHELREERFRHRTDEESRTSPRQHSPFDVLTDRRADAQFLLYKPEFRRHYEKHYAAFGEFPYEDYLRAYRYGLELAQAEEHRRRLWPDIASEAGRHWEEHMALPWRKFREAARYGWYQIRGDAELYGGTPRG